MRFRLATAQQIRFYQPEVWYELELNRNNRYIKIANVKAYAISLCKNSGKNDNPKKCENTHLHVVISLV